MALGWPAILLHFRTANTIITPTHNISVPPSLNYTPPYPQTQTKAGNGLFKVLKHCPWLKSRAKLIGLEKLRQATGDLFAQSPQDVLASSTQWRTHCLVESTTPPETKHCCCKDIKTQQKLKVEENEFKEFLVLWVLHEKKEGKRDKPIWGKARLRKTAKGVCMWASELARRV